LSSVTEYCTSENVIIPQASFNIATGDARSIPQVGPELMAFANDYQQKGSLPKFYDTSVLRFVDGVWYAPEMCMR
jgi:hypothetical protein